jgi:hypothetical protein
MTPNEPARPPFVLGRRLDLSMSEALAERADVLKLERAQDWTRYWLDQIEFRLRELESQIAEHAAREHQNKEDPNG